MSLALSGLVETEKTKCRPLSKLKAQRALRDGDYEGAEKAYHDALRRLGTSEYANSQTYIEARAVVLDKVSTSR